MLGNYYMIQFKRFLVCLMVGTLCCGCSTILHKENYKVAPVNVKVQVIDTNSYISTHTYVGVVKETKKVPMSFNLGGTIEALYVQNGMYVKKGQRLVRIDSVNRGNVYRSAKAQYDQALDGFERAKKVYDQGGLPEVQFVDIKTKLSEAKSLFSTAQKELKNTVLYAPCDGVISDCDIEVGQNVVLSETVLNVLDIHEMYVNFAVPEQDISKVKVGDPLRVDVTAVGSSYSAKVVEKDYSANVISHTYRLKGLLKGVPSDVMPGMLCKVQFTNTAHRGFIIPGHCVQTTTDGLNTWVIEDGRAMKRTIVSGAYSNEGIFITDGLHKGDTVVIEGDQKLYKGAVVNVID